MIDDSQTATPKNKGGRPRKPSNRTKGAMVWVSAEYMELMTAYLEFLKQQHNKRQAKQ